MADYISQEIKRRDQGERSAGNVLIFTYAPAVGWILSKWLEHHFGGDVEVESLLTPDLASKDRAQKVAELKERSSRGGAKPIVMVGTYGTMSTGWDGFQQWVPAMIALGMPLTARDYFQAVSRVYRESQALEAIRLYGVFGYPGSTDQTFWARHKKNKQAQGVWSSLVEPERHS